MDSVTKGAVSELIAATWLLNQGYQVFRNVSAAGPFDLVALRPGETIYIDVKTVSPRINGGVLDLGASDWNKSALPYQELNRKLLYVYQDQCAWRIGDIKFNNTD